MATVEDILAESRSTYLNDPSGNKYTDAIMLPIVRSAYGFMQTKLQGNGLQSVTEEAERTFAIGETEWAPLPVDFVIPVKMQERQAGTTDEYRDMRFYYHIPRVTPGPYLEAWTWRVDRLLVKEPTTTRQARLYYRNSFPGLNTVDAQLFGKAEQYLSAKSAALAMIFIDQSTTLASAANEIAENELGELVNLYVKAKQSVPVRRKAYMPFRDR